MSTDLTPDEASTGVLDTLQWHPSKRVRHIKGILARRLPRGSHAVCAALFVPWSEAGAKDGSDDASRCWKAIYVSERVRASSDPDWAPVSWVDSDLPSAVLASKTVLLSLYGSADGIEVDPSPLPVMQSPTDESRFGAEDAANCGRQEVEEAQAFSPAAPSPLASKQGQSTLPDSNEKHYPLSRCDTSAAPAHPDTGAPPLCAWRLDLGSMVRVPPDFVEWEAESVALHLDSGWYAFPTPGLDPCQPPAAVPVPSGLQTPSRAESPEYGSPPRRGADTAGRALPPASPSDAAAGEPGVPRRLAALLMSRLLPSSLSLAGGSGTATPALPGSQPGSEAGDTVPAPCQLGLGQLAGAAAALAARRAEAERLRDRVAEAAGQLAPLLERREAARRDAAALLDLRALAAQLEARRAAARARARRAVRRAGELRAAALACAQAQATALRVMLGAARRLRTARDAVTGEEGHGRLLQAFAALTARRCRLLDALGEAFELQPSAVMVAREPSGGYLEERLERRWAGSSAGVASRHTLPSHPSLLAPGLTAREVQLSILGRTLDAGVWRKAFLAGGYDADPGEDRAASVAAGYAAQVVQAAARYLGVPLRYPLRLEGSTSAIASGYAPAGGWRPAPAPAPSFFSGAPAADPGAPDAGAELQTYPLHCTSDRDRPRFGIAVYLLNKDVAQLLQAHGMSAGGPSHLLANLHKLLAAARSAGLC
ncbi:hypothetical protein ACKKBF_B17480 [Auxenochlorella protothecoides x Auxenochlorella symbiontica]